MLLLLLLLDDSYFIDLILLKMKISSKEIVLFGILNSALFWFLRYFWKLCSYLENLFTAEYWFYSTPPRSFFDSAEFLSPSKFLLAWKTYWNLSTPDFLWRTHQCWCPQILYVCHWKMTSSFQYYTCYYWKVT